MSAELIKCNDFGGHFVKRKVKRGVGMAGTLLLVEYGRWKRWDDT